MSQIIDNIQREIDVEDNEVKLFKNFVNLEPKSVSPFNGLVDDSIDQVVINRKFFEKIELNNDCNLTKDFDFEKIISDMKSIIIEHYPMLFEIIRDHNIKSKSYLYSQILLKLIFKVIPASTLLGSSVKIKASRKIKQKKEKEVKKNSALDHLNDEFENFAETKEEDSKYNKIDLISNFGIIKTYTEKHIDRLEMQITNTYLLETILDSLFLIPN